MKSSNIYSCKEPGTQCCHYCENKHRGHREREGAGPRDWDLVFNLVDSETGFSGHPASQCWSQESILASPVPRSSVRPSVLASERSSLLRLHPCHLFQWQPRTSVPLSYGQQEGEP